MDILQLDRYSSITQPLKYLSNSKSKSIKTIVFLWLLSCTWMIPINCWTLLTKNNSISFLNSTDKKFTCNTAFETNKLFKIITTILNFYVPLIGMVLIFSKIYFTIKNRKHLKEFKKRSHTQSKYPNIETSKRFQIYNNYSIVDSMKFFLVFKLTRILILNKY